MPNEEALHFKAQIIKVQTTSDMAIRITLDLPETAIDIAAAMMQARQAGAVLACVVVAVEAVKETWRGQPN